MRRRNAAAHPAERSVRGRPPPGLGIFVFAGITGQNEGFAACALVQLSIPFSFYPFSISVFGSRDY